MQFSLGSQCWILDLVFLHDFHSLRSFLKLFKINRWASVVIRSEQVLCFSADLNSLSSNGSDDSVNLLTCAGYVFMLGVLFARVER